MSASVARGPVQVLLQSGAAQWMVLGLGALAFFPHETQTVLRKALLALTDGDGQTKNHHDSRSPIVIHTGGSISPRSTVTASLVNYAVGAGFVWVSYTICVNYLPEQLKEYFPVTRRFFDQATQKLAQGIYNVKEVLGKQIINLSKKQDALGKKQDETHKDVLETKHELSEARSDLSSLAQSLTRCETSLSEAERLQLYTAKGVKLLVRCIAMVMPGDSRVLKELADYSKDGERFQKQIDHTSEAIKKTNSKPTPPQLYDHPEKPLTNLPHEAEAASGQVESLLKNAKEVEDNLDSSLEDLLGMIRDGRMHAVRA